MKIIILLLINYAYLILVTFFAYLSIILYLYQEMNLHFLTIFEKIKMNINIINKQFIYRFNTLISKNIKKKKNIYIYIYSIYIYKLTVS